MSSSSQEFLDRLNRIVVTNTPSNQPDPLSQAQQQVFERNRIKYNRKVQKAQLKNFKQDISMRREYANRIYNMLAFLAYVYRGTVFLVALGKLSLSENVIIALLTTSSANVIAIFIYVVKYLYAKPEKL